jgi:hypothetical protein
MPLNVAASAAEVINGDQDVSGGHDFGDPDLATRGQVDDLSRPHVAKKKRRKPAAPGRAAEVVDLATERNKRLNSQGHSPATRGQKTLRKNRPRVAKGEPYIEPVKASKGTWAFRIRWREDGRRVKPIYISRVSDAVYEMIREGDYDSFKEQLIASHMPGAVRAGNRA